MRRILVLTSALLLAGAQVGQSALAPRGSEASKAMTTTVTLNVPIRVSNWPDPSLQISVRCYVLSSTVTSVAAYHALSGSSIIGEKGKAPIIGETVESTVHTVSVDTIFHIPVKIQPGVQGSMRGYYCFLQPGSKPDNPGAIGDMPRVQGAPYTPEVAGSIEAPAGGTTPVSH